MTGEKRTAIVTASYDKDFDRCALLCETIDRYTSGFDKHYLLVAHRDVAVRVEKTPACHPDESVVDEDA